MTSPRALLIQPPVYDFALYDHYLKPYGLLKLGAMLQRSDYGIQFINGLDYRDYDSEAVLGPVSRKNDGTGKFFRQRLGSTKADFHGPEAREGREARSYARYGIIAESLEGQIASSNPDIVLIGTMMTYWYPGVIEVVESVRRHYPDVPVIAGGIYASLLPDHCRDVCAVDHVIQGEAGEDLNFLLEQLGMPPCSTAGEGEEKVLMKPSVWRDAAVIRLNKGCPFSCKYCASRIICPGFKAGDPEKVYRHMREFHRRFGTQNFAFYDDALLVGPERPFKKLLELIIKDWPTDRPRLYLPNAVHITELDEGTARLMKRAGFQEVRLGFESSSEDFHRRYDKKSGEAAFADAVKCLYAAGFNGDRLRVYILAGLPGQYAEEVEESVRYAAAYGVQISLAEYSPVPKTALWEESVRLSRFPIAEEPLYHNNSIFPTEWKHFSLSDRKRLKDLVRNFNRENKGK